MTHYEHVASVEPIDDLIALEPKPIEGFVPSNGLDQKEAFFLGRIRNPDNNYARLERIDFPDVAARISMRGELVMSDPALNPKFSKVCASFISTYQARNALMQAAYEVKRGSSDQDRQEAKQTFMKLNREHYGEPDEATYRSLLGDKLTAIASQPLDGEVAVLRDELFTMTNFTPGEPSPERFKPSDETVAYMHDAVNNLFSGLLRHVPEQPSFDRDELVTLFATILHEEFGDSAEDWQVVREKAVSINVRASKKRVIIPEDLQDRELENVKDLVVHELGVHVLRSIMGDQTDLQLLAVGLDGYYDSEEGLGIVMQQARKNQFKEPGTMPYITAGAVYFDHKDFRDTFEMRWRLDALDKLGQGKTLDEAMITKSQQLAYTGVTRILRGTDELPWFKDLAYYNGTMSMWKHVEAIRGDDTRFMFLLLGKADPSRVDHEQSLYETRTP